MGVPTKRNSAIPSDGARTVKMSERALKSLRDYGPSKLLVKCSNFQQCQTKFDARTHGGEEFEEAHARLVTGVRDQTWERYLLGWPGFGSKPDLSDARELLAPVYGWFIEGFGTLDLKEASDQQLAPAQSSNSLASTG
jgi:hypothetical protein